MTVEIIQSGIAKKKEGRGYTGKVTYKNGRKNFTEHFDFDVSQKGKADAIFEDLLGAGFAPDGDAIFKRIKAPTYVLISPPLAVSWLTRNGKNRRVAWSVVEQYAAEMRAGRWKKTGESISFNPIGELLDGQHRLWAIVRSGVSAEVLVVPFVEQSAQVVIDSGFGRTVHHNLSMYHGVRDAKRKQAMARVLRSVIPTPHGWGHIKLTVGSALEIIERHEASFDWVCGVTQRSRPILAREFTAPMMAALAIAWERHPDETDALVHRTRTGEEMREKDPAQSFARYVNLGIKGAYSTSPRAKVDEMNVTFRKVLRICQIEAEGGQMSHLQDTRKGFDYFIPNPEAL